MHVNIISPDRSKKFRQHMRTLELVKSLNCTVHRRSRIVFRLQPACARAMDQAPTYGAGNVVELRTAEQPV